LAGDSLSLGQSGYHLSEGDRGGGEVVCPTYDLQYAGIELDPRSRGSHRGLQYHPEVHGRPDDPEARSSEGQGTLQQIQ